MLCYFKLKKKTKKMLIKFYMALLIVSKYACGLDCGAGNTYKYFAANTDYEYVANTKNFNDFSIPQCRQIGLWHLIRAAASTPPYDDMFLIDTALPMAQTQILNEGKSVLCADDVERLRQWKSPFDLEQDERLTQRGHDQIKRLGLRMRTRMMELFFRTIINKQIIVKSTNANSTIESAKEYLKGSVGYWPFAPTINWHQTDERDYLLDYANSCENFLVNYNSINLCPDVFKYELIGRELNKAIIDTRNKMGLSVFTIGFPNFYRAAYKMCQYQYLLDGTESVWCRFFNESTLRLEEFRQDMQLNCLYGYRSNISSLMGCDLMNELLTFLKTSLSAYQNNDKSLPRVEMLFTNANTMLSFLSTLRIAKNEVDSDFDPNDIGNENVNRKYKVGQINAVNTNLAFVTYDCRGNTKNMSDFNVRVFHNENLIKLDVCDSVDCNYFKMLNMFSGFMQLCKSTNDVCKLTPI